MNYYDNYQVLLWMKEKEMWNIIKMKFKNFLIKNLLKNYTLIIFLLEKIWYFLKDIEKK